MTDMETKDEYLFSKVPEGTIFFWIIKILCTTAGSLYSETLGVNK